MHMTAIVLRVRSAGKIEKLRVIYAYFFQIIKELMEIDVRSELSNYRGGYSRVFTKCSNHAYTGASIPSKPMKYYSPSLRKTCYKKSRKNFSSSSAKISYDLYFSHWPHPRL